MKRVVSKEHTMCGSISKLSFIVRTEIGPSSRPKNPKRVISLFGMEKAFYK
jgi:hypothetical protein